MKPSGMKANKKDSGAIQNLRKWNIRFVYIYLLQMLAIFIFATSHTFPVTTDYVTTNTLASNIAGHTILASAIRQLFMINVGTLVMILLFISVLAHASMAWWYRKRYESDLSVGTNRIRWIDYATSSGLIVIIMGLVAGISDIMTFAILFVLMIVSSVSAVIIELGGNKTSKIVTKVIRWLAVITHAIVWLSLIARIVSSNVYGSNGISDFVYWLYGSLLLCSLAIIFAVYSQQKREGKWSNYLYGERILMFIIFITKTALVWQIFGSLLHS